MRSLILFLLTTSAFAYPVCQDVYDPMAGKWVRVCKDSSEPRDPVCENIYNARTGKWEFICTQPRGD